MVTHFSNCIEPFEKLLFWVPVPLIFIAITTGFLLFSQERSPSWKSDKKGVLILELLGPFHPIFTTKYLKPQAVKYRLWFFGSVSLLIIYVVSLNFSPICIANT